MRVVNIRKFVEETEQAYICVNTYEINILNCFTNTKYIEKVKNKL